MSHSSSTSYADLESGSDVDDHQKILLATQQLCNQFQALLVKECNSCSNLSYLLNREPYYVRAAVGKRGKYHKIGSTHDAHQTAGKGNPFYTIALVDRFTGDVYRCSCQLGGNKGPLIGNVTNMEALESFMTAFGLYK